MYTVISYVLRVCVRTSQKSSANRVFTPTLTLKTFLYCCCLCCSLVRTANLSLNFAKYRKTGTDGPTVVDLTTTTAAAAAAAGTAAGRAGSEDEPQDNEAYEEVMDMDAEDDGDSAAMATATGTANGGKSDKGSVVVELRKDAQGFGLKFGGPKSYKDADVWGYGVFVRYVQQSMTTHHVVPSLPIDTARVQPGVSFAVIFPRHPNAL